MKTFLNSETSKRICRAGTLLCLLLLGLGAIGQTAGQPQPAAPPEAKPTFEQLVTAAKLYFRDTAEFPLIQKTDFTVSDASGRIRNTRTLSLNYVFQGYSRERKHARGTLRGKISFWDMVRGAKVAKLSGNSALWTIIPGMTLYSDPHEYAIEMKEASGSELLTAKLIPVKACPELTMKDRSSFYFPDFVCGAAEFQIHSDLSFQTFVFEASGLPAHAKIDPLGQCTLQRYHVDLEFQKVTLPGDKEPFLVPKQVTATLNTNKGNIVIASAYEPRLPKK